eukprot:scaffold261636_cov19-Tisochrysis_lutea.AAC.1
MILHAKLGSQTTSTTLKSPYITHASAQCTGLSSSLPTLLQQALRSVFIMSTRSGNELVVTLGRLCMEWEWSFCGTLVLLQ